MIELPIYTVHGFLKCDPLFLCRRFGYTHQISSFYSNEGMYCYKGYGFIKR